MKNAEAQIARVMREHARFLICSHVNPDGDALGSSIALALYLEREGKEVWVFNQDPVPALYAFLPGTGRVRQEIPTGRKFDVSFLLDCATPRRAGDDFANLEGKGEVVVIDHHPPAESIGTLRLVRTGAAATSELLYEVMMAYGVPPQPEVATALYVALLTDTGSFRFSNTTAHALAVAARLLELGADHRLLIDRIYESYPAERFSLLGLALGTLKLSCGGKAASVIVTREMYRRASARDELTEGFVDFPRSIAGVEVAVLFREVGPREYRVNLRSRGAVDVGSLAARFQGGGHPNAAGCTLRGEEEEVQETLLRTLAEALP